MNSDLAGSIRRRYQEVLERISERAVQARRDPRSIRLVVVTKSQPLPVVQAAVQAGACCLGENYVEEAAVKVHALATSGIEWHMIGHVQGRKAAEVVELFTVLHSLDSLKLAQRLERFCLQSNRRLRVLLEFNVGGEASKSGFPAWEEGTWPALAGSLEGLAACKQLEVRGLMTMPPFFQAPEQVRPYFQRLRTLQAFLARRLPDLDWSELSMGTSGDYLVAVEEGATIVRIGQAILGPRPG